MVTFIRRPELHNVTPESFIRCVLEAAELGLAIDGRLAHAVKFSNKQKVNGKEVWRDEAQLMVDYKGVIATARRTNVITDCYARIVREGDRFACGDRNGQAWLEFEPSLAGGGAVLGAFAVVKLPGGEWRHEWMNAAEIHQVRGKSKSFQKKAGPWCGTETEQDEMRKKTVIRRALKTYADDPAIARLLELDDREYEKEDSNTPERSALPLGRSSLRGTNGTPPPADEQTQPGPSVEQYQAQEPPTGPDAPATKEQWTEIDQLHVDKDIVVHHWRDDWKKRHGEREPQTMTQAEATEEINRLMESTGGE
jgi:recombination protein RecT